MSHLGVSSEVVPGGTGEQGMLLYTPKSSRLAPYIPQKTPEALKSGTKKASVSPSLCPHKTTASNLPLSPVPSGCPLSGRAARPSPWPGSCRGPPTPSGSAVGVPGLPGARSPPGSGARTAHTVRRQAGNRADVSAAGAPQGPCRRHSCPDVRRRRGEPCRPSQVPRDPCAKGFDVSSPVSGEEQPGFGWKRRWAGHGLRILGRVTGFWVWRAAQAVLMMESLVELPNGGLVGLVVPETRKSAAGGNGGGGGRWVDAHTWFLWNSEGTLCCSALSIELSAQLMLALRTVASLEGD